MLALSSVRSVCWSAFRTGSLAGFVVRPSRRSPSGVVVVVVFGAHARAVAFARRWSARLGVALALRRSGAAWAVSLPVAGAVPFGSVSAGPVAWVGLRGGLRGLSSASGAVASALL